MPGITPTDWLDVLKWGTGLAETPDTIGTDRLDTRVPPSQYYLGGLQISRLRQLLQLISEYYKGGSRLRMTTLGTNPFSVGEAGFWSDGISAYYTTAAGVVKQLSATGFFAMADASGVTANRLAVPSTTTNSQTRTATLSLGLTNVMGIAATTAVSATYVLQSVDGSLAYCEFDGVVNRGDRLQSSGTTAGRVVAGAPATGAQVGIAIENGAATVAGQVSMMIRYT